MICSGNISGDAWMSRLCLFQLLESFKKSTMKVNEQDAAVHTTDKSEDSQKKR